MPDFNPFDMDFDGDVDGIDFLGFHYLTRHVLQPDEDKEDGNPWEASCIDDERDDDFETEDDFEESEMDEDDWQETDADGAL